MSSADFTAADIEYVRANFRPLDELCRERGELVERVRALVREGRLPQPSYVLPDGSEMVPGDYFALVDSCGGPDRLRAEFDRRHRAAGGPPAELQADWEGYIAGLYGICLRCVSPEAIVRKSRLVESVGALLERPALDDPEWRAELRQQVDELDSLEREFSPDYDRHRLEGPPSRDLLIGVARGRYPELFAVQEVEGAGQ